MRNQIFISVFVLLLSSCSSDDESVKNYIAPKLSIVVPTLCIDAIKLALIQESLVEGRDYERQSFLKFKKAYSNIDGFVTLIPNETHSMDEMIDISSQLGEKCYAGMSISIIRDGSEWQKLGENIVEYEQHGVAVHSIMVTDSEIKVFVNINDLSAKIPRWGEWKKKNQEKQDQLKKKVLETIRLKESM